MGIDLPTRRLVGPVRVMTMIKPRCMVLNISLFSFISPWLSLAVILDDIFFLLCFSAQRRIPGDDSSDRTVIVKKFFLSVCAVCKGFFLW